MRGLDKLHPEVRAKAERLQELCRENGLPLLITETWRSKEEQDALYARGRTVPGKVVTNCTYPYSAHCWGVAFDFCRNIRGREYETADGFFEKVGRLGKSIGLFWGGDFKSFKDMPHFEHPGYVVNNSVKTLVEKWGTPDAFKKSWGTASPSASEFAGATVAPAHFSPPPVPESASIMESEYDDTRRLMPDALKKIQPSEEMPAAEIASDSAWEWAVQTGLAEGINRQGFITGEALVKLLYSYNAVK